MRSVAILSASVSATAFIFSFGVVRSALGAYYALSAIELGALVSLTFLIAAVIIPIVSGFDAKRGLAFLNVILIAAFVGCAITHQKWCGVIFLLLIGLTEPIARVWTLLALNQKLDDSIRATTLSTLAMCAQTPYVIMGAVAGYMFAEGYTAAFCLFMATGSGVAFLCYWILQTKGLANEI